MRTFLTLILAAICVVGYAQKKPKINQAISALEEGQLSEAKSIIDAAIVHEKTKDDPKTWYYRGQIYAALDTANNEEGALDESLKAFDKALELDPEQKSFNSVDFTTGQVTNIDSKKQGYYAYYYNEAITAYNNDSYEEAADNFETAFYIMPTDTNAVLNAAYASAAGGNEERAEANFKKCYEAGMKDKTVFLQLYNYATKDERLEDGLTYIKEARKIYPNDIDLAKYEINLLIRLERTDEAMTEIENSIKEEPDNADLLFSLGVLKDETGDKEGAWETYKRAIEVDPDHFNSYFNMGAMLFNDTNALVKEQGALNYYPGKSNYKAEEKKKYETLNASIEDKLTEALPIWEKLHSLKSEDADVMTSLIYVYKGLGKMDKAKAIQSKLDALN